MYKMQTLHTDTVLEILSRGTYTQAVQFLSLDTTYRKLLQDQDFHRSLRRRLGIPDRDASLSEYLRYDAMTTERKIEYLVDHNDLEVLATMLDGVCSQDREIILDLSAMENASIEGLRMLPNCITFVNSQDIGAVIASKEGATVDDVLRIKASDDESYIRMLRRRKPKLLSRDTIERIVKASLRTGNLDVVNFFLPIVHDYRKIRLEEVEKLQDAESLRIYLEGIKRDDRLRFYDELTDVARRRPQFVSLADDRIKERLLYDGLYYGFPDIVIELAKDDDLEDYLKSRGLLDIHDPYQPSIGAYLVLYQHIAQSKGLSLLEYLSSMPRNLTYIKKEYPGLLE